MTILPGHKTACRLTRAPPWCSTALPGIWPRDRPADPAPMTSGRRWRLEH